ncbi:MAG TPA: hypothetical protein GX717_06050 [Clostridiaceae bacterium]|nr:hypothetical protein [Clostridiaceae bacterium]
MVTIEDGGTGESPIDVNYKLVDPAVPEKAIFTRMYGLLHQPTWPVKPMALDKIEEATDPAEPTTTICSKYAPQNPSQDDKSLPPKYKDAPGVSSSDAKALWSRISQTE